MKRRKPLPERGSGGLERERKTVKTGWMKLRFAALALVGRYRLLRGEIDWEMIVLLVVTCFVLLGVTVWFLK